jgi:hypothetical protein
MNKTVKVSKELKALFEGEKERLPYMYYNFMIHGDAHKEQFEEAATLAFSVNSTLSTFISLYLQGKLKLIDGKYFSFCRPAMTGDVNFDSPFEELDEEYEIIWYNKPAYTMVQGHAAKIHESDVNIIKQLEEDGWTKREVIQL